MSSSYITLWSQPQIEAERRESHDEETLSHTANDQFRDVSVEPGDRVYIVGTDRGLLLLLARLTVEQVVDQHEAERRFGADIYKASDHLIGDGTALRLDRVVPEAVARTLERASGKRLGIAPDEYRVDVNSLRRTGRITDDSAALLDALLEDKVRVRTDPPVGVPEGQRQERRHQTIERSRALRALALAMHGTDCLICEFSFREMYGSLGDGFAEVHHLAPLGSLSDEVLVDPATDVVVLCANCHRMVHRKHPPLIPDQLRETIAHQQS